MRCKKVSQNWFACHKMEMVYNECLNTFSGLELTRQILDFLAGVLKESNFFFKFFVKLNTQNSHRKCHRIVKTYHSQVVCDGGERVVLGLIYKLWLFVFQLFERV